MSVKSLPDFVVVYHGNPLILAPSLAGGYEMDCPRRFCSCELAELMNLYRGIFG